MEISHLIFCLLVANIFCVEARPVYGERSNISASSGDATTSISQSIFQNTSQVDVISVLLLLGEVTIWKAIWTRFRSRRLHWKQWIFAISPGWTPLAATIFTTMNGPLGPTNLIDNRPPESTIDEDVMLTNLNSGATHAAKNIILQNIWHTWKKGARNQRAQSNNGVYIFTKEFGVADVNIDKLHLENALTFWSQMFGLAFQIIGSFILWLVGYSLEIFIVLLVALVGQTLLLVSITPRSKAWWRATRGYRSCAVMLHKGFDSTEVLIIRRAEVNGKEISLEEYCWDTQAAEDVIDRVKALAAFFSFVICILQVILIGWMTTESRYMYLMFGGLGLLTTMLEAGIDPDWLKSFKGAFSRQLLCAPSNSTLMASVGFMVAAQYPATGVMARLLYPDGPRLVQSLHDLEGHLSQVLCQDCREAVRQSKNGANHRCQRQVGNQKQKLLSCSNILRSRISTVNSKQIGDSLATVCHYLESLGKKNISRIDTMQQFRLESSYNWTYLGNLKDDST